MNDSENPVPMVTLNNGIKMPQLGLGVWQVEKESQLRTAVETALDIGYRSIDTATVYGNEAWVGDAVAASGLSRNQLFITTKLWNDDQGYDETLRAFDESMKKLQLDYLDLYLIHWPLPKREKFIDTWKAFEKLYEDERIRAIGVSNFTDVHLDELMAKTSITPAVNQIELHPKFRQDAMRRYSDAQGIQIESWSPLMQGKDVLGDETILEIAETHGKTAAQIVLRWHIQHDLVVIPKSVTPERIRENFDVFDFELDDSDMKAIDDLGDSERVGPNPDEFN